VHRREVSVTSEPVAVASGPVRGVGTPLTIASLTLFGADGLPVSTCAPRAKLSVRAELCVDVPLVFDVTLSLAIYHATSGVLVYAANLQRDGWDVCWLPQGSYTVTCCFSSLCLLAGSYVVRLDAVSLHGPARTVLDSTGDRCRLEVVDPRGEEGVVALDHAWQITAGSPAAAPRPLDLGWRRGLDDWFHKHFDFAARIIVDQMLERSPLLSGRILDVGCGEGITDLGIFLRVQPELLVGLDVEGNFRKLPEILARGGIALERLPERLVFRQVDANDIPYADDTFDVVISWASLEHIAGGYERVLEEVRRVLKDGGLFFVHPGMYYSARGHHLAEFSSEPHVHLKRSPEELRRLVLEGTPTLMDRAGIEYTASDFWRYYTELVPITVHDIEGSLRRLGFEFRRVAVRTDDVAYTPELQAYPIQDLTTAEVYLVVVNRKHACGRPTSA
jgi:SAM-dependent methyltransferase